jgi:DNA gyrase subunit A
MIPNEEVVISISSLGYIKRTKTAEYRAQTRGGTGSKGSKTRDTDQIDHLFVAKNHNYLLLFTEQGRCFWLRVYEVPEATKTSTGRVLQNIVAIPKDDKVKGYILIEDLTDQEYIDSHYIIFCTEKGIVKKTVVEKFSRPRTNGINAITIHEGDQLLEVKLTNGQNDIIIANANGRAIRFPEEKVRSMGRSAAGVRGIRLDEDGQDKVIGMISIDATNPDNTILVVSQKGSGKRSLLDEYRTTNRGGKGVKTMKVTEKTGKVVSLKSVTQWDDLMITTKKGIMIRTKVGNLRVMGRATQGVKVITLKGNDTISDVAVIRRSEHSDEEE